MSVVTRNRPEMTSHDKLCAAISIVQREILARDSALVPEKMFGTSAFPDGALELAERMLVDCIDDLEHTCEWNNDRDPQK